MSTALAKECDDQLNSCSATQADFGQAYRGRGYHFSTKNTCAGQSRLVSEIGVLPPPPSLHQLLRSRCYAKAGSEQRCTEQFLTCLQTGLRVACRERFALSTVKGGKGATNPRYPVHTARAAFFAQIALLIFGDFSAAHRQRLRESFESPPCEAILSRDLADVTADPRTSLPPELASHDLSGCGGHSIKTGTRGSRRGSLLPARGRSRPGPGM